MASVVECDRCGKQEKGTILRGGCDVKIERTYLAGSDTHQSKELCESCTRQLDKFFEPLPNRRVDEQPKP